LLKEIPQLSCGPAKPPFERSQVITLSSLLGLTHESDSSFDTEEVSEMEGTYEVHTEEFRSRLPIIEIHILTDLILKLFHPSLRFLP